MHQSRTTILALALGFAASAQPCATDATAAVLPGIRAKNGQNPVVWVRSDGSASLDASWLHTFYEHDAVLQLFSPDGRLAERDVFAWTAGSGTSTYPLAAAGDWKVVVSESNYTWDFDSGAAPVVLEPKVRWGTFRATGGDAFATSWYFHVPAGTTSFTLHANAFGGTGTVRLQDPAGSLRHTFNLNDTADATVTVSSPVEGDWSWTGSGNEFGVWLTGLPNVFSTSPSAWFEPATPPATASVDVDGSVDVGPSGSLAVQYTPHATGSYSQVWPQLRWLGFKAVRLHPGDEIETTNDNADPMVADLGDFDFDGWNWDGLVDAFRDQAGVEFFVPILFAQLPWLGLPPWTAAEKQEFAEYAVTVIEHANVTRDDAFEHWEIFNEPEWEIGEDPDPLAQVEYLAIFEAVRDRVRAHPDARVNTVKLGGPTLGSDTFAYWNTPIMEALLDGFDTDVAFLSWHNYIHGDLHDTWRFADDVATADAIRSSSGDATPDEELMITEFNQFPGTPVVPELLDGHYASVWYASAVAQHVGTGKSRMFTYYELLDSSTDTSGKQHKKGFIAGTYPDYERKPVAWAAHLLNRTQLPRVISSTSDHEGLEVLATASDAGDEIDLLVVNKGERDVSVAALSVTPVPAEAGSWYLAETSLTPSSPQQLVHAGVSAATASPAIVLARTFAARTVTSLHYTRTDPDPDADGVAAAFDNCPADANASQSDADGDGIGDACSSDDDADGVDDLLDNCPATPNAGQEDGDGDGDGDRCDNCPVAANAGQDDADGDSVGDACDLCPASADQPLADLAKAQLSGILAGPGQGRMKLDVRELSGVALEPTAMDEIEVLVRDAGGVLVDAVLAHPASDPFWSAAPSSPPVKTWRFRPDDASAFGGVSSLQFKSRNGLYRAKASLAGIDLSAASGGDVAVTLRAGSDRCWTALPGYCTSSAGGDKLTCR